MCLSLVSCDYFVYWKEEMHIIEEMDMKHVGFVCGNRIVIDRKGVYHTYRHIYTDGTTYKFLIHVDDIDAVYNVFSHRPTPAPDLTRLIRE